MIYGNDTQLDDCQENNDIFGNYFWSFSSSNNIPYTIKVEAGWYVYWRNVVKTPRHVKDLRAVQLQY